MKKLLVILGSVTIMGSASSLVVACKSKPNANDGKGTVIVDNGILDPNGQIKIDAAGLLRWYQKNIGSDGIKQIKDFNQLFAVGLMVEAANEKSKIFYGESPLWKEPTTTINQYGLESFPQRLKELWGNSSDKGDITVQGAANNAFEKFETSHNGKNSKANVVKELTKLFPYIKPHYENLKSAWINNYILSDPDNGGLAKLTKLLWENPSQDLKNDTPDRQSLLQSFYRLWPKATISSIENDVNEAIKNGWKDKAEAKINFLNLINATGGTNPTITTSSKQAWRVSNIQWADQATTISPALVKDVLARLYSPLPNANPNSLIEKQYEGSTTVSDHWSFSNKYGDALSRLDTYFSLVDDGYPNADFTKSDYSLSSEGIFGFLSNSQRFGIDQYFVNQKPVALSEIVFKKSESGDLAVNINGEAFLSPKSVIDNTWSQFYGFYNFLQNYVTGSTPGINTQIPGISQYNFDTIFGNIQPDWTNVIRLNWPTSVKNRSDKWDTTFYEVKNDDKLLTLSDTTHSNILRYSVYDFIQAANNNKDLAIYKLNPQPVAPGSISQNLVKDYGFVSTSTADIIEKSVNGITDATLKTEVTNGLYATLNLIELLNRKATETNNKSSSDNQETNKIYQVLNKEQGIIAFIDTDGLHITKINGYDVLSNGNNKHPLKNQNTNVFGASLADRTNYINQTKSFKRLNDYVKGDTNVGLYRYVYQDYDNQIFNSSGTPSDDPFINKIVDTSELTNLSRLGVSYEQLNASISNDYEKFLVNNSILNSTNPALTPFYKFNIFNEVKDYLTVNDKNAETLSPNNSAIIEYVGTILGFDPSKQNQFISEILNHFMKFDSSIDSQNFKEWLSKVLATNMTRTKNLPQLDFRGNWVKWNKEINDSRVNDDDEKNKNLPLMILDWGDSESHIKNILSLPLFAPFVKTNYDWKLNNEWYDHLFEINISRFDNFKKITIFIKTKEEVK